MLCVNCPLLKSESIFWIGSSHGVLISLILNDENSIILKIVKIPNCWILMWLNAYGLPIMTIQWKLENTKCSDFNDVCFYLTPGHEQRIIHESDETYRMDPRLWKYQIFRFWRGSILMDSRLSKSDNFGFRRNQLHGLPIMKIPNFGISALFDTNVLPIVEIW